jgi:hypothetical protein
MLDHALPRRPVVLTLLLALLVAGCTTMPGFRRNDSLRPNDTIGWKQVFDKSPPAYLIAVDRSVCTVSAERFAQIRPGQRVLCDWKHGSGVAGALMNGGDAGTGGNAGTGGLPAAGAPKPGAPSVTPTAGVLWPQPVRSPAPPAGSPSSPTRPAPPKRN